MLQEDIWRLIPRAIAARPCLAESVSRPTCQTTGEFAVNYQAAVVRACLPNVTLPIPGTDKNKKKFLIDGRHMRHLKTLITAKYFDRIFA